MIEHVSLPVADYERAKSFYGAVLAPLGYTLAMDYPPDAAGFKEGGHTSFWIVKKKCDTDIHIAFNAKTKRSVHDFYDAAIRLGAKDNGPPGPRPEYDAAYYAAFIIDLDGHNIEAVCFEE